MTTQATPDAHDSRFFFRMTPATVYHVLAATARLPAGRPPDALSTDTWYAALLAICFCCSPGCDNPDPFDSQRLSLAKPGAAPAVRSAVRAFYSGHSLSDGIPPWVKKFSSPPSEQFHWVEHNLPGSTIEERWHSPWPNVQQNSERFTSLVITERHDLLYALLHEHTLGALMSVYQRLAQTNPQMEVLLYQGWLEIDWTQPQLFVQYERQALVAWECTASAFNRILSTKGQVPRASVLPGGWALAHLVEQVQRGELPGKAGAFRLRVPELFRDNVHLSAVGQYFLAALHYSFLFGKRPEKSHPLADDSRELSLALQKIAWKLAQQYFPRAKPAAKRTASLCRDYTTQVLVDSFVGLARDGEGPGPLRRWKQGFDMKRTFADPTHPQNPYQ